MEEREPEVEHLSPSQLGMFLRCGEQYRRRYLEGEKVAPGLALIKGSAVDGGVSHNYAQKIESRQDLELDDVLDATATAWRAKIKEDGVELTPEERAAGRKKVFGQQKDSAIRMTALFQKEIAPKVQPVFVQEKIVMKAREDLELWGILDLATEDGYVVDVKTSKKKKSAGDVEGSDQLSWYAAAYRARTGRLPKGVRFDVVVDTGKNLSTQQIGTVRTIDHLHALNARVGSLLTAREKGVFAPAPEGAWWCSRKFCGYFPTCAYVRGR